MPESTPDPTPSPAPPATPPTPKKRKRSPLNAEQSAALRKAEKVGKAALKPAYLARLTNRRITEEFLMPFMEDIKAARGLGGAAVSQDVKAGSATSSKAALTDQLLVAIEEVQSAARQEFYDTAPERLSAFYCGEDLRTSRDLLTTMVEGIVREAHDANLPGIDDAKIGALRDLFYRWGTADDAQGDEQSGGQTLRGQRDALVASIEVRRRKVQFAANAEWQYSNPANAPIRREFQLPTKKPFTG